MRRSLIAETRGLALLLACSLASNWAVAADKDAQAPAGRPAWVALWQDAFKGMPDPGFDPERMSTVVLADRTTGDVFLSMWNHGVWQSSDSGKTFTRVDAGKVSGGGCGPIQGNSFYVSPEGKAMATFNMNNGPGPSGYSIDGGKTWESFTSVERNWDFGAMDWDSKLVIGARHEDDGLHVSLDCGKTWARLTKSRNGVSGLAVLGKRLLLATAGGIEQSEDEGKTWTKISDLGATGPAVSFKGKTWWLSEGKRSVIVSGDQGKTWALQGVPAPAPVRLGPFFGKNEDHIVLVGDTGFYETADGGKTWKLAVALPEDAKLQGAAFDPVHDVFYLTSWTRPVMKYARQSKPEYSLPVIAVNGTAEAKSNPKAEFADEGKAKLRCFVPVSAAMNGPFLYFSGEDGIFYFKRDLQNGKLGFVEQTSESKGGGYNIRIAGGRLYSVTPHDGYPRLGWHGLAWSELDAQTGKPTQKEVVPCPASQQMIVGPEQKDLYLKACRDKADKVFWYRIAADGKPVQAGEVMGKGIGASAHSDYPGILQMSPDGKNLYAVSAQDYAIACIERKPNGEIAYKNAIDLEQVAKRDPGNYQYLWVSLGISPDGKWVYANVRNGKPTENFYGIFKRDPATGDLKFQEKFSGEQDMLANMKGWNMMFSVNGTGGYLGNFAGPMMTFGYDEKTGRLSNPAVVKETKPSGTTHLVLDAENGLLYVGGREFCYDRIYAFKVDKKAAN